MNPAEFPNIACAEESMWWYRGMRDIVTGLLDPLVWAGQIHNVLDGGCGTGHNAEFLARRYGWNVTAMDISAQGLALCRSRGLRRLVQADMVNLPFHDASFDAAVSFDVLVHFPEGDEVGALRELCRVLRPGGLLVLRVAALNLLRSRHSRFIQERQRFTRRRLLGMAERCGLKAVRCTYANSILLPAALAKFRVWEPMVARDARSGVAVPHPFWNKLLYGILRAEAAWLAGGGWFPIGQSLFLVAARQHPNRRHLPLCEESVAGRGFMVAP